MPRQSRSKHPGAVYHVISRGNNHKEIVRDDDDRIMLLNIFADICGKYGWRCYAYCLMDNHYHFLVETPADDLSEGMHRMNTLYAQRFNRRHNYSGHLFQDRFKSIYVQKNHHFFRLIEYIQENPVRAKMVTYPAQYYWSSYQEMMGTCDRNIVDSEFVSAIQAHFKYPVDKGACPLYPQGESTSHERGVAEGDAKKYGGRH